jgi:hypothetical protein
VKRRGRGGREEEMERGGDLGGYAVKGHAKRAFGCGCGMWMAMTFASRFAAVFSALLGQ